MDADLCLESKMTLEELEYFSPPGPDVAESVRRDSGRAPLSAALRAGASFVRARARGLARAAARAYWNDAFAPRIIPARSEVMTRAN
jgi:hypothetical protein